MVQNLLKIAFMGLYLQSVIEQFSQVKPKVLFSVEAYVYNQTRYEQLENLRTIVSSIGSRMSYYNYTVIYQNTLLSTSRYS